VRYKCSGRRYNTEFRAAAAVPGSGRPNNWAGPVYGPVLTNPPFTYSVGLMGERPISNAFDAVWCWGGGDRPADPAYAVAIHECGQVTVISGAVRWRLACFEDIAARDLMGRGGRRGARLGHCACRRGRARCLALAIAHQQILSDRYSPRVVAEASRCPRVAVATRSGQPYTINGQTYTRPTIRSYRAEGIASWYGPDFHGRLTAMGEIFDMHGISAATRPWPIPSYARVTNSTTGKSLIVRVNDRRPLCPNRIIAVSTEPPRAGFYGEGLAPCGGVEYVGARAGRRQRRPRLAGDIGGRAGPAPAPAESWWRRRRPSFPPSGDDGGVTPVPAERPSRSGRGRGPDPAGWRRGPRP